MKPAEIFSSAIILRLSLASFRTTQISTWDSVIISDKTGTNCFFFAGGGTGGHLYPAIAVAEQLIKLEPDTKIFFFCSSRNIDVHILSHTDFEYSILPVQPFPKKPFKVLGFLRSYLKSSKIAAEVIAKNKKSIVTSLGGFVSGPVCRVAYKKHIPIALLNVDSIPGLANKIIARWANGIFVHFQDSTEFFPAQKVTLTGCPIRAGFKNPRPQKAIDTLNLDKNKKTLLITGASSGSQNINEAIISLLDKLAPFADSWQVVHLAGLNNIKEIEKKYLNPEISYTPLGYFDDMPNLLAAADLVIGRSGAGSVAEFAASGTPSICIPYPYHKDRQQYLNAEKLVEAGAAVIVDDIPDKKQFSANLWHELQQLLQSSDKRQMMAKACQTIAHPNADIEIAKRLLVMATEKLPA